MKGELVLLTGRRDQHEDASSSPPPAFFHDPGGMPFACIQVGDHYEVWPIRSPAFAHWLGGTYWAALGVRLPRRHRDALVEELCARATFEGPERDVHVRIAPGEDGHDALRIDLGVPRWRVVVLDERGWHVAGSTSTAFRRPAGMRALPVPVAGGSVDELRALLNVVDDAAWRLLLAWVLGTFRPKGPFPLLFLQGEQGSAKSTMARMLRALIDPSEPALVGPPATERDLLVSARSRWLLGLDNISTLRPGLSDAFCRLATGGGYRARSLFTDLDETLFEVCRPVMLTSIDGVITRGDLAERTITLALPVIQAAKRRTEADVWRAFDEAKPRIFGALLTLLGDALRELPRLDRPRELPRLADFGLLGVAIEKVLGWPQGSFLAAYEKNLATSSDRSVDASAIGEPLLALLARTRESGWTGTAGELLTRLRTFTEGGAALPGTPEKLRHELTRLAPALRRTGWRVMFGRREPGTGRRLLTIEHEEDGQ